MLAAFSLKMHTFLWALLVYVLVWKDTFRFGRRQRATYKSPASQTLLQYKLSSQNAHFVSLSAWAHFTHASVFGALML
jgi:hypothetical protein